MRKKIILIFCVLGVSVFGGISEILMLDECICSFLLVIKNYLVKKKLLLFVRNINALWVPY